MTSLKRTPLHDLHRAEGARMVEFSGWEMPVQYQGITEEHLAVRDGVGIFDISHMGQLYLSGPRSGAFLDYLLPLNMDRLSVGRMSYTVMCAQDGGAIDDFPVYRIDDAEYLLVVNAGRLDADVAWIEERIATWTDVEMRNASAAMCMLAIQGPGSEALVASALGETLRELNFFGFEKTLWDGEEILVSRSGYTGEDGFEVMCSPEAGIGLWKTMRDGGASPIGLGARDTLRTEMGYCLYGHELNTKISPLEAGLDWALALDKEVPFFGREALRALRAQDTYRRLAGVLLSDRGIPRPGYDVLDSEGRQIGSVSSGTFSPSLQRGIALAFLDAGQTEPGNSVGVVGRGKTREGEITRLPMVPANVKRRRKKSLPTRSRAHVSRWMNS